MGLLDSASVRIEVADEQLQTAPPSDHLSPTALIGPLQRRILQLEHGQMRLATQRVFSAIHDAPRLESVEVEEAILDFAADAANAWERRW